MKRKFILPIMISGIIMELASLVIAGIIFSDDFSGDLSKWSIKGSPLPSIISYEGNPPPGFCTNDDLNYGGYAVSKQTFEYLGCDFEVSIDVKQGDASYPDQRFSSVYLVKSNVLGGTNEQPKPAESFLTVTLTGNSYGQTPGWPPPPADGPWFRAQIVYNEGGGEQWEDSGIIEVPDGDGWHNVKFRVRKEDGKVGFYLDNDLLYTSTHQIVGSYDGAAAICLGDRLCYHDNVIVTATTAEKGSIVGKVTECDGTSVLNAKVEAKQDDNLKGSALTDASGQFTISNLEFGKYDVVASKQGYESDVKTGISISESETTAEVNFILRVMKKDTVIPYDNIFDPNSGEYATIKYNVLQDGDVDMKILDSRGREIKTLVTGHKSSGSYIITWNGKDDNGKKVGSGIYLIQLKTNRGSIIKKIAVVK